MIEIEEAETMGVVTEPTTVLRRQFWKRPMPLPLCLAVESARILSAAQHPPRASAEMICHKTPTTLLWRHPSLTTRGEVQAGAQGSPAGTMIRPPLVIPTPTTRMPTTRMLTTPMLVDPRLIVGTEGAGASPARARVLLVLAVVEIATIATIRARWRATPMLTRRSSARTVLTMIRYFIFIYFWMPCNVERSYGTRLSLDAYIIVKLLFQLTR